MKRADGSDKTSIYSHYLIIFKTVSFVKIFNCATFGSLN